MKPPLFTRAFVLAAISHSLHALSYYLLLAIPGFFKQIGAEEIAIGVTFGAGAAAAIALRPPIGRIMDTKGRRVIMLVGGLIAIAVCFSYLLVNSFGPLVVGIRVFHGIAEAMLFASLFAYASDIVPAERRIEGIAIFGVSGLLPMSIGAALSDQILRLGSYSHLFMISGVFALFGFLCSLPLYDVPREPNLAPPRGITASIKQENLVPLWIAGFTFAVALAGPFTFMKTYMNELGQKDVGSFFTTYGVAATMVRIFFGQAPDRYGPKVILAPSFLSYILGLLALTFWPHGFGLGLAGFLCGVGHGFVFPILLGLVVNRAHDAERGAALSVFTALFDGGMLVGAPLLGVVIRTLGYTAMFAISAVVTLIGSLLYYYLDRRFSPLKNLPHHAEDQATV